MSRIGKKPVVIPAGVTAKLDGQTIAVKGAKGELKFTAPDEVSVSIDGGAVHVQPHHSEDKRGRAMWGMTRAQIANLIGGVTHGFERKLEINGVGYKAAIAGKNLQLSLGYSHDIVYPIPAGVTITTPKPTEITVAGIDKRQVGQIAAEIRAFRGPEPYKGKGVKYAGEFIFRKEGKKK
ncbi:50S ribosomal protein L6 [Roseiarcus sp.]|uniref:50S ribosomal protein L6 n=1 Tax=Roseiarcus sp. TaxID=1969460 RepID=UPI003F988C6E